MTNTKKINSNRKGRNGERELARLLRGYGYDARRGQQYCGATGDADVVGLPGVHIEVKRTEKLSLYDALAQSIADARPGEMPIVVHRRNDCQWVVIQPLEDWMKIFRECEAANRQTVIFEDTDPHSQTFGAISLGISKIKTSQQRNDAGTDWVWEDIEEGEKDE